VLVVAAAGAGGSGAVAAKEPPTRLWYRISAEVTEAREGAHFEYRGDARRVQVISHYRFRVKFRVRSRHAVLLFRQCLPLGLSGGDPKLIARVTTAGRSTVTCAEMRAFLRENKMSEAAIRRLRLVDDVRFTADAVGLLTEADRASERPAFDYGIWHAGTPLSGRIYTVTCPSQRLGILRFVGLPLEFRSSLGTASAVRDGVSVSFALPRGTIQVEAGSTGGPCVIPELNRIVEQTRLTNAPSSPFLTQTTYGFFPADTTAHFRSAGRFGRAFTIAAKKTLREPPHPAWQTGPWVSTFETKLRFTPCPRGGRDVAKC
jgi:hypothetical protein